MTVNCWTLYPRNTAKRLSHDVWPLLKRKELAKSFCSVMRPIGEALPECHLNWRTAWLSAGWSLLLPVGFPTFGQSREEASFKASLGLWESTVWSGAAPKPTTGMFILLGSWSSNSKKNRLRVNNGLAWLSEFVSRERSGLECFRGGHEACSWGSIFQANLRP